MSATALLWSTDSQEQLLGVYAADYALLQIRSFECSRAESCLCRVYTEQFSTSKKVSVLATQFELDGAKCHVLLVWCERCCMAQEFVTLAAH